MNPRNQKLIVGLVFCISFHLSVCQAQLLTGYVNEDNRVVIVEDQPDRSVLGIGLYSEGGYLIPIPPGGLDAPATPFRFLTSNSSFGIEYVNLGVGTLVGGELELSAAYDPPIGVLASVDLRGACNTGGGCVITFVDAIPEPASWSLGLPVVLPLVHVRRIIGRHPRSEG